MINTIVSTVLTSLVLLGPGFPVVQTERVGVESNLKVLASREFSLDNRYGVTSVNEVMKKNILLYMAYLSGSVSDKKSIDWSEMNKPFKSSFELKPGEVFAFHDLVKAEYQGRVAVTTGTDFSAGDGYLSDGYLYGDGVCHLASLVNWVAQDAGLEVVVPKDHRSVGSIPGVADEYGVSIYKNKAENIGANNNLYITNTKGQPVTFHFEFSGSQLRVWLTQGEG